MILRSRCLRAVLALVLLALGPALATGQETDAATRQYAAAVALQNRGAYSQAADEWLAFISKFPQDPRLSKAHHYLGVCYYQSGKPDQATSTFETVLANYPNFELLPTSYLYLGVSQYAMAQAGKRELYEKALQTLGMLIAKYPQGEQVPDALYYRGECLYGQGKKAEAVQSYTQLVAKYPEHKLAADATYALGVAQEESGQMEAAGKTYEGFLARYGEHRLANEVDMRRAETLLTTGQPEEAARRFAAAAARPGFALADYALLRQADALVQLKRYPQAAELYSAMLAKFPQSQYASRAALSGGKCLFLAGRYADARPLLNQAVAAGGATALEGVHWTAQCLLKEHQPAAALRAIEKVLPQAGQGPMAAQLLLDQADAAYEIPDRRGEASRLYAAVASKFAQDPVAPQALYMAAFTALEQGDANTALARATAFQGTYPNDPLTADVLHIAAESNMQLSRFAEADSLYAQLLQKFPAHADAELWKVRRVVSLHAQKRYQETIAALTPLIGSLKSPESLAEAHYLIGSSQLETKQFDAAAKSLAASLAAQPKWRQADETLLALAHAYRSTNNLAKAAAAVQQVVADFPDSRYLDRAHFRLGEYASLRGDFGAAASEFNQVVTRWPQGPLAPHALHELGCAQLNQKNAAQAEATLTSFLDRFSQHPLAARARYARAMARHQQAKYAPAAEDLPAALAGELTPSDRSDARFLLGLCQVELKQYPAAEATFAGLLKDDPGYAAADKAQYQLAWTLKLEGREMDAAKAFQQLLTTWPKSPLAGEAQFNVGEFAYGNKNYTAASNAYYEVVQKEDGTPLGEKATHKLAWCYYHLGNYASAQKTFSYQRGRYEKGPLAADGLFMEAECSFKQGQFSEALAAYQALPDLANKEFESLALLHAGQAAGQLKQWDKSTGPLARCLQQFPEAAVAPEVLYELGWANQNQGKLAEAIALYRQAIEKADKLGRSNSEAAARAQFMIGEVQFQNKEHNEAVKSFFKVAYGYNYPRWQADATYEAGRCFEVLGQKTQAIKMYQEVAEKFAQSDKTPLAKQRLTELQR